MAEKGETKAPVAITVVGVAAGLRGAPKWPICLVKIASLPLFVVGLMAA